MGSYFLIFYLWNTQQIAHEFIKGSYVYGCDAEIPLQIYYNLLQL